MKKNILLLLLASALLAGCATEFSYIPRKGGKYVPFEEAEVLRSLLVDSRNSRKASCFFKILVKE